MLTVLRSLGLHHSGTVVMYGMFACLSSHITLKPCTQMNFHQISYARCLLMWYTVLFWWCCDMLRTVLWVLRMTSCFHAMEPESSSMLCLEEVWQVAVSVGCQDNYSVLLSSSKCGTRGELCYLWLTSYSRQTINPLNPAYVTLRSMVYDGCRRYAMVTVSQAVKGRLYKILLGLSMVQRRQYAKSL